MVYVKNVSNLKIVIIGVNVIFQQNIKNWTSRNHEVDEFIQKTQLKVEVEPKIFRVNWVWKC